MSDSLYHPLDPAVVDDPYPAYARLRREAPVYPVPGLGLWAVSRYDDVTFVLTRPDLFSSSPLRAAVRRPGTLSPDGGEPDWQPETLIGSDPPLHTRLRKIANRGFTRRRIAALEPRIREIARELVGRIETRGECELVADLAVPLPVTVIAELLGIDPERLDDLKRWSDAMIRAAFEDLDDAGRAEVGRSVEELGDYLDAVTEARRARPRDDMISALLKEDADGAFTPDEIESLIGTLLVAGNETTTNLISSAVLALLRNPGELARVQADPGLVPGLVEEALRYDAPVQTMLREATADTELAGTKIPKGAIVLVLLASANRDERAFPDPDRFDVRRDTSGHVAFGLGTHFCLGSRLARLEARVAFEELLPVLQRPCLREDRVPRTPSLIMRPPGRLRLTFEPAESAGERPA